MTLAEPKLSTVATFSPRRLRPFVALAKQRDLDVEALLAIHGTTEAALVDPETRLPRVTCVSLMKTLFTGLRDPLVGLHAAQHFELADMDLVGYAAQQYETVLSALEALVDYASLIGDASRAKLLKGGGQVVLELWVIGEPPQLPELADYAVASTHHGVCQLAGSPFTPLRVELARPRPATPLAYRQFFGSPVLFGAARGRLVYDEASLRVPRARADARLAQLLLEHAEAKRARVAPAQDLGEQARTLLASLLSSGTHSVHALARALAMSERTLRRRLDANGCSYRQLLDAVRRERALALVGSPELNVSELAEQLGFTDPAAFARAFRRWTGSSPTDYRRGANSGAPQRPNGTAYKPPESVG